MHFKKRLSKYQYQPNLGVKVDFETILFRFSSANTVRYETFAAICREMKLADYCAGRASQNEAREFVEECFQIATKFWLPPSQFLVRAGALYLLYCLYNFQLVAPKAKIRVTVENWQEIVEFQAQAREQQHLDLDYVFQRMKLDGAFTFVATPLEMYPQARDAKETNTIPENLKEDSNSVGEVFSSSVLNQLALVHEQYHKMKVALNTEDESKPDSSLDIIHSDLIRGIYKTLQVHKERQMNVSQGHQLMRSKENDDEDDEEEDCMTSDMPSLKRSLKRKAYEALPGYTRGFGSQPAQSTTPTNDEVIASPSKQAKPLTGRTKPKHLFEKDDDVIASGRATLTRMEELFHMPDISKMIPRAVTDKTDAKSIEENKESSSKGKAPLKGKALKKRQKRTSQEEEVTIEGGNCADSGSTSMEDTPTDTRETSDKQTEDEISDSNQGTTEKTKVTKKKGKVRKGTSVCVSDKRTPKKVTTDRAVIDTSNEMKGPSAQQKLQELLNKRRKEAREKNKGK